MLPLFNLHYIWSCSYGKLRNTLSIVPLVHIKDVYKRQGQNGQIATQYVDMSGEPTADIHFNPNNSAWAIEGIVSPDGRIIGKMGHSERIGDGLYKNVPGRYDMGIFSSAVEFFK